MIYNMAEEEFYGSCKKRLDIFNNRNDHRGLSNQIALMVF